MQIVSSDSKFAVDIDVEFHAVIAAGKSTDHLEPFSLFLSLKIPRKYDIFWLYSDQLWFMTIFFPYATWFVFGRFPMRLTRAAKFTSRQFIIMRRKRLIVLQRVTVPRNLLLQQRQPFFPPFHSRRLEEIDEGNRQARLILKQETSFTVANTMHRVLNGV